jgi:HK97 gp10 family phage protein
MPGFVPSPRLLLDLAEEVKIDPAAEEVLAAAEHLVPVDTGALKDSLHIEDAPGGGKRVVADTPYAVFVEFGTENMPAEPYLRPALDEAGLHR